MSGRQVDKGVQNAIDNLRFMFAEQGPGGNLPLPDREPPERLSEGALAPTMTFCSTCGEQQIFDRDAGLLLHVDTGDRKCSGGVIQRKE